MERKIGEVFECDGVKLRVEKEIRACNECYFKNLVCDTYRSIRGECQSASRSNGGIIFVKIEDMETRLIKLTLEKAKEFYKKGGEFRELALSAFTEEELTKVELPKTWEEFCKSYNMRSNECFINLRSDIASVPDKYEREINSDRNVLPSEGAAKAHLALMQLHQLRDCYRQGWKPDWSDRKNKYCIVYNGGSVCNYIISINAFISTFLSFQSREVAQLFLDNFRNLIEEAGDLI